MSVFQRVRYKYQDWKKRVILQTSDKDKELEKYGTEWDELGYHRPMAAYFYTFGLLIPSALFSVLLLPLLQFTRYRFPEITGLDAAATALFGIVYAFFDAELHRSMNRFIPQYAVSNVRKAVQYSTFFIKYQMWSGLIQITLVNLFIFVYIIPYTSFAYLAWFLIFISVKQYPSTLGFFQGVLESFQFHDKAQLIVFWRANIIEPLTQIGFGLIGLFYGAAHPAIGEFYGLAFGWAIGGYIDDLLFTFPMGMWYLSKVLDKFGIKLRELYAQKVEPETWKSALNYAARFWPSLIWGSLWGWLGFFVNYQGLPGYMTYSALIKESNALAKFVGWSDDILNRSQASFAEAYNNDKIVLTKHYIAQGLKWNSFFFIILGSFNIVALPIILDIALGVFLPEQWEGIRPIVPFLIVLWIPSPLHDITNKMLELSKHPEILTILGIIAAPVNTFFAYYFLFVLKLGWVGMVITGLPMDMVSLVVKWIYMKNKVLDLDWKFWKGCFWQVFAAPLMAGIFFVIYIVILLKIIWPVLSAPFFALSIQYPMLLFVPVIITLILLMGGLLFIYMPLYGYLGGFDENTLEAFKKSVALSGPSLWIIYPFYKIMAHFHKKAPEWAKKRAPIEDTDLALKELKELMILRYEARLKQKAEQEEQ